MREWTVVMRVLVEGQDEQEAYEAAMSGNYIGSALVDSIERELFEFEEEL